MLKIKIGYDIIKPMENLLITNKFFFLEETKTIFSTGHFIQIFIMLLTLVLCFFIFKGKKHWEKAFFIVAAVLSNLFMLLMFVYSVSTGIYNPEWYFPAHICNLFMLIFPVMAIFKDKVRQFLYDYTFYFGLAGCFFAIILPATTQIYFEPFSYIATLTWLYHLLIGVAGVYLVASGNYFPKISTLWQMVAVFIPLAVVAAVFNVFWDTNFVFLNINKMYFPLSYFEAELGKSFAYGILGFIILAPSVLLTLSLSVLKAKHLVVSEVMKSSSIFNFLKQHSIVEYTKNSKYVQNLKTNPLLTEYFDKIMQFIDLPTLEKCYNSIEEQLKTMTVAQLEDARYVVSLVKKSKIIPEVIKQMSLKKFNSFIKLFINAPVREFISQTSAFISENKKETILAYVPING